jgi:riboflavin biosynthesis pyrimidine reductase
VDFTRLYPEPATVDLLALLTELRLDRRATGERPYLIANFISSVDGRAAINGRSGALGDDGDHAMFHGLREQVDCVLAGTGTLRTERYGRLVRTPERVQRRLAKGLAPTPLLCVITRSGRLPEDLPLLEDPESTVAIYSGAPVELSAAATITVTQLDPPELTPRSILRHLRAGHGVGSVLCEGGPTLFAGLVRAGVVDELFLTLAPKLAGGGTETAITAGPELPAPAGLTLAWTLERAGSLFLRYRT